MDLTNGEDMQDDNHQSYVTFDMTKSLSSRDFRPFEKDCRRRDFEVRERILEQGETTQDVYFMVSGTAAVLTYSSKGRFIAFATINPGDFFGELAAIDGLPRSATVLAKTKCTVSIMPAKTFRRLISEYSDAAFVLINKMAAIIRIGDAKIAELSFLGGNQRICLELLRLAETLPYDENKWIIKELPTQVTIAANAGVSREAVSRYFAKLSDMGIIRRDLKTLYIQDRNRIEELVV